MASGFALRGPADDLVMSTDIDRFATQEITVFSKLVHVSASSTATIPASVADADLGNVRVYLMALSVFGEDPDYASIMEDGAITDGDNEFQYYHQAHRVTISGRTITFNPPDDLRMPTNRSYPDFYMIARYSLVYDKGV